MEIRYSLLELMRHFGYADGSVPTLTLGRVSTDSVGEFEIATPALIEDPFFNIDQSMVEIRVGDRSAKRLSLKEFFEGRIEVVVRDSNRGGHHEPHD